MDELGSRKIPTKQWGRLFVGAAMFENLEIVRLLLDWGVNNKLDAFQSVGLHWIFQSHSRHLSIKRYEIAKLFLRHGADVNSPNQAGRLPIHLVARQEISEITIDFLNLFWSYGAIGSPQIATETLLILSTNRESKQRISSVKLWDLLLDLGADFYQMDRKSNTLLHHVCSSNGHFENIQWLVENFGMDPLATNDNQEKP